MKRFLSIVFFAGFFFSLAGLEAASFRMSANTGLSSIFGNTTYDITFHEYDPYYGRIEGESELEFDIAAALYNVGIEMGFLDEVFVLSVNYSGTMNAYGGTLRDRDWITNDSINYYYDELMGDTDSDVDSEVDIVDINLKWYVGSVGQNNRVRFNVVAGYQNQKWGTFEASNIDGYYSGLLTDDGRRQYFNESFSSPVLTYEVTYDMFYGGFGADFKVLEDFILKTQFNLGYVSAEDEDDHILRQKFAEGETDGIMADLNLDLLFKLSELVNFSIYTHFKMIDTEGDQTQWEYDSHGNRTYLDKIDDEITSEQFTAGLKVEVNF